MAIKDGENVFGNKEVTVPATEQVVSYEETTETELAEEVMEDTPSSVEEDVDSMVFDFPA